MLNDDLRKCMTWRQIVGAYVLILLLGSFPILSVLIASGIASLAGAKLNEADAHPCVILGVDIGGLLYAMFVMGWLGLATIPLGFIGIIAFTFWWVIERLLVGHFTPPPVEPWPSIDSTAADDRDR